MPGGEKGLKKNKNKMISSFQTSMRIWTLRYCSDSAASAQVSGDYHHMEPGSVLPYLKHYTSLAREHARMLLSTCG